MVENTVEYKLKRPNIAVVNTPIKEYMMNFPVSSDLLFVL